VKHVKSVYVYSITGKLQITEMFQVMGKQRLSKNWNHVGTILCPKQHCATDMLLKITLNLHTNLMIMFDSWNPILCDHLWSKHF